MKILCIGNCCYDINVPIEEFPIENKKYRYSGGEVGGGGPANNAAYLLGSWGEEVYFAGLIGNDDYGDKIKKELQSVNVSTNYLETDYEMTTPLALILVNKKAGTRTVFSISGEYKPLKKCELDFKPDIILTDGHDPITTKRILQQNEEAISIIDAGRPKPEIIDICKMVKYLVCSKEFAETITKQTINYEDKNTLVNLYTALKERFSHQEIIITLEDKGVLYAVDGNIKLMPAMEVEENDTTGAGDIFHGAFTYGLAHNMSIDDCVKYANIAGGISCTRFHAKKSIPTLEEVKAEYDKN